jgi:hypothetical protein
VRAGSESKDEFASFYRANFKPLTAFVLMHGATLGVSGGVQELAALHSALDDALDLEAGLAQVVSPAPGPRSGRAGRFRRLRQ